MIRDRSYGGRDPRVRSPSPLRQVGLRSRDRSSIRGDDELGDRFSREYHRPRVRDHKYSPGRGRDDDMMRIREPEYSPRRVSDSHRPRNREFKYSPHRGGEDDRLRTRAREYSPKDDDYYDGFRDRGREYLASPRHSSGAYDSMRDVVDGTRGREFMYSPGHVKLRTRGHEYLAKDVNEYDGFRVRRSPRHCSGEYDLTKDVVDRKYLPGCQEMKEQHSAEYERPKMKSIDSSTVVNGKYLPERQDIEGLRGAEYERPMRSIDSMKDVVDGKYLPGCLEVKGLQGAEHERTKMRSIDYLSRQHSVEGTLDSDQFHDPKRVTGDYGRRLNDRDRRRGYEDGFLFGSRSSDCDGMDRSRVKGRGDGISSSVYHFNEGLSRAGTTSSKFQWNHLLSECGIADGVKDSSDFVTDRAGVSSDGIKDSSDFGVGRTGIGSETDYFTQRFLDTVWSERLSESKPMSLEAQNGRGYTSSYQLDNTAGHSSLCLGNSLHKTEDLHPDAYLTNKARDRPLVIEDNCFDSKDKSGYFRSSSGPEAGVTRSPDVLKEESPISVGEGHRPHCNGVGLRSGKLKEPLTYDGYGEMSFSRSSVDPAGRSSDIGNFAQPYVTLTEEKHRSYAYPITDRSDGAHIGTGCGDIHDNPRAVAEEYVYQDMPRSSSLDPILDKIEHFPHQRPLEDSKPWNHTSYSDDYNDAIVSSHVRKQDMNVLGYLENPLEYKREVHMDYGNNQQRESLAYGAYVGPWCYQDKSEMFIASQEYDLQRVSPDLSLPKPSTKMLKRRHIKGNKSSNLSGALDMTSNRRSTRMAYNDLYDDKVYSSDDSDPMNVSRKCKFTCNKYEKTEKKKADILSRLNFEDPSYSLPSLSNKTRKSAKERLGLRAQDSHTTRKIRKKNKASMKKQSGPGLSNNCTLPWMKNCIAAHERGGLENGSDESPSDQGSLGESTEDYGTSWKPAPSENSAEFKQLVHGAFFKFVKVLNETPGKRTYLEQGKAGILKCIVCGSDSEEFVDTKSLASHALECEKADTRSQHVGFHKALCTLMGWRSAKAPRDSWVCEMLSDVETSALKEDLIIWPAVVIIHNHTIASDPEKRIIVTIEELEVKLKEMGFGNKIKVGRGKPANQSTMIVKFGATLSGLLDAERLHKVFDNTKRGRDAFKQDSSSDNWNSHVDMQMVSGDGLPEFLYGYLGIAEDLDKLDFETKKRCLIKSKKEIHSIADTPVETSKLQHA